MVTNMLHWNLEVWIGVFMPFIGTTIGALIALFMKNGLATTVKKCLMGFASGIMIAASFWGLLEPAIEYAEEAGWALEWLPPAIGFAAGILFLLLLDGLMPHIHAISGTFEGRDNNRKQRKKSTLLALAVTMHNIPEGMAVGVVFAGALSGEHTISIASALVLALVITLHNLPEGAIVSASVRDSGVGRGRSFLIGAGSGIVEPIAALVTFVITSLIITILPFVLAFAAGAMLYVVVEELIPEAMSGEKHSNLVPISFMVGFLLLMIMDVAFH